MEKSVSIIVPLYNYGHYLSGCIKSINAQTYPVKEIIIVNDGSTDNSLLIANEYRQWSSKITVIDKKNGGLSSARNVGIREATGDYIMCLDADDKLTPGAIEEHVKLMEDKTIAQCALMEFGDRYVVMIPTQGVDLRRLLLSNTIFCNALYPRKAWEEVGGYDESELMRWGLEDYEFWIRLMAAGYELKTSDFIALRYRVHEGQMTQATSHPHQKEIRQYIFDKHKDLYDKFNLEFNDLKII